MSKIEVRAVNATVSSSPWQARQHAEKISRINRRRFTPVQQSLAETTVEMINRAYDYHNIYVNYRQKFIAIKVSQPRVDDRDMALSLDRVFGDREYVKVLTPQGIIFRIPR